MWTLPRNGRECSPAESYPSARDIGSVCISPGASMRRESGRRAEAAGGRPGRADPDVRRAYRAICPRSWNSLSRIVWHMPAATLWKSRRTSQLECRFVLESLGEFTDSTKRRGRSASLPNSVSASTRKHSGPVMETLHIWLNAQFDERKVEPNSGLGDGDILPAQTLGQTYLVSTQPGAPLDNNICERALRSPSYIARTLCFTRLEMEPGLAICS